METWKPIKGFEGLYEVSDEGRVRRSKGYRCKDTRVIKLHKNKYNYFRVRLWKEGKRHWKFVHRLVYEAFVGEIPEGIQVNHLDENKSNNKLSNLNLLTAKENSNWGTRNQRISRAKVNGESSKAVYGYDSEGNLVISFPSTREAQRNGFNSGAVGAACKNKFNKIGNNKYKGLYWRYEKMGDC